MSTQFNQSANPYQPAPQSNKDRNKKFLKWGLIAVAVLVFLGMCSALMSGGSDSKTAAGPTPTVTKTVTVEKVPQSCLVALDKADEGFTIAADSMNVVSDAFSAIANQDVAGLQDATDRLKKNNGKLDSMAPDYRSNKEACRASASRN